MAEDKQNIKLKSSAYQLRMLACIALTELIVLGLFSFWPISQAQDQADQKVTFSEGNALMEEAIVTRQSSSPPPPPRPQVPIPVPNDEIIEEEMLRLQDIDVSQYADSMFLGKTGEPGSAGQVVKNPQTPPRILRIVEPTIPDAAQQAGVKAKVWVSFLVDKEGKVEEANISRITLYNEESEEFLPADSIGHGLTEATLKAALEWGFRPATDGGQPVKAYSTQIFTYGF